MPKDPDIKSSGKKAAASKKPTTKTKSKPKAGSKSGVAKTADKKQLSFHEKLNKFGIKREPKKKTIVIVGVGALVALLITISTFGVMIYKYKSTSRPVKIASKIIPYPVSSVNGNWVWNTVTYNQYLFELASIQKFYQSQGQDLSTEEGKQKLNQLKKLY